MSSPIVQSGWSEVIVVSRKAYVFRGGAVIITVGLTIAAWWLDSALLSWALALWIGFALIAALGLRLSRIASAPKELPTSRPNAEPPPYVRDWDRVPHDPLAWPIISGEDPPVMILPPEPDLLPLLAVIDQHRAAYARQAERLAAHGEDLKPHRQGVRDAFAWNLDQIQPYLDGALAREEPERLARLPEDVERAAELLTLGPWCVGYAYLQAAPSAAVLLHVVREPHLVTLPVEQRDLVESAIAHAHRLFVSILNGYYASEYGRAARRERDGHLLDASYGAFTRAALKCFQLGVAPAHFE